MKKNIKKSNSIVTFISSFLNIIINGLNKKSMLYRADYFYTFAKILSVSNDIRLKQLCKIVIESFFEDVECFKS